MTLCAFVLVSSEFLPVSLLTPMARDMIVSEGQAGQAIAASGLFAVLTSLSISSLTRKLDRKLVILWLTGLMIVSGAIVAFAPSYPVLLAGRAVLGIAIGGCWSMSTAVLMRISNGAFLPRAIATLQGGSALATAVAAPMGSLLGSVVGWRGAFFCLVPLAALALIWQAVSLPRLPAQHGSRQASVITLLSKPGIFIGLIAVAVLFMGQFALFTYLRPFLETVTHVDISWLSIILLLIGLSGLAGTAAIGPLVAMNLRRVLVVIPALMAGVALALASFGGSFWPTVLLLAAWGLIATPAPVGWFTWLSQVLPDDAEAGGGLMVAVIQLAITLGATMGGAIFDATGVRATFEVSAALLVLAAFLAAMAARRAGQRSELSPVS
ncbi:putative MFS family arabinose efflux permease [Novosphingobium sp. PhB55]|uniref:MFS transporter n=1 Tax=Novosphingobium sp. PhB55 TaxID=2485106 RepID=UPI0010F1822C|nr:MFS transporter [Novosphingobium sp. PhB55]TDW61469.1 putative MFS family arabinose efflux permease [Novosphingobium sp. PhB55]